MCLLEVLWLTLQCVAAGYLIKIILAVSFYTQTSLAQHKMRASNDFFMTASGS